MEKPNNMNSIKSKNLNTTSIDAQHKPTKTLLSIPISLLPLFLSA